MNEAAFDQYELDQHYQAACRQAAIDLPDLLPKVGEFLAKRDSKLVGTPTMYNSYRLVELHYWLERHKPRTIVELGSGATTLVFVEYAAHSGATILAFEEQLEYVQALGEYLEPKGAANLKAFIVPRVVECRNGEQTCRYDFEWVNGDVPQTIDLLYVDGPDNRDPEGGASFAGSDPVRLAGCRVVRNLLVDIRLSTIRAFLASPIGQEYNCEPGAQLAAKSGLPWYATPVRHHSWLRKK